MSNEYWTWYCPAYHGDEIEWNDVLLDSEYLRNHESVANSVAKQLCEQDPSNYGLVLQGEITIQVKSPSGEIKSVDLWGYTDFVFSAREVIDETE